MLYEVRKGASFQSGQQLGRVAHPPFNVQGDGTYWVAAYSQPVPGLQVYSDNPQPIVISGAQIISNVIAVMTRRQPAGRGHFGVPPSSWAGLSRRVERVTS